ADPRMPVNLAEPIAKAGIPVLLLYGGQDQTVPPAKNCELFASRFKAAGGKIDVVKRGLFGHHPHGVDPDKTETVTGFFLR
ncbi:MAG TPA: SGNH/GDSL hydrolase family protein, partial [Kiritimatiellia bacterium]|nr:SGNH/GDSL hydrolase family protein [Kiritimatiellia bacterium]